MRLFLDTAEIEEIREINRWGVLGGVTTNPTLVANTRSEADAVWRQILAEVGGDVSLETTESDADAMYKQGVELAGYGPNAVVKVPMSRCCQRSRTRSFPLSPSSLKITGTAAGLPSRVLKTATYLSFEFGTLLVQTMRPSSFVSCRAFSPRCPLRAWRRWCITSSTSRRTFPDLAPTGAMEHPAGAARLVGRFRSGRTGLS